MKIKIKIFGHHTSRLRWARGPPVGNHLSRAWKLRTRFCTASTTVEMVTSPPLPEMVLWKICTCARVYIQNDDRGGRRGKKFAKCATRTAAGTARHDRPLQTKNNVNRVRSNVYGFITEINASAWYTPDDSWMYVIKVTG